MKTRKKTYAFFYCILLTFVLSCTNNELEVINHERENRSKKLEKKWEEVYRYNFENKFTLTTDDLEKSLKSVLQGRNVDYNIFLAENITIYPTQNIVASKLYQGGEWIEVKAKKNPHSLIFDFKPIPYIEEINTPKDNLSYSIAFRNAMRSDEWHESSSSGYRLSAEASFMNVKDFNDFKMSFGGSLNIAGKFKTEASYDEKRTKYKTVLLARLKASNFKVDTYISDKVTNDKPVWESQSYVSSITYGKV